MVKGKCFVIIVSSFRWIQLNRFLEALQGLVVLLVFEIGQPKIILSRSIVLDSLTCFAEVRDALRILFYLSIAIPSMEKSLEVSISCLYVLQPFSKVLDG